LIELLAGIRPDVDFASEKNLTADAILDSFDIVTIGSELNEAYNISIGVTDLLPENFNSVEDILALIERKQQ